MSVRLNGTADQLAVTLGGALTVGTGAYNVATMFKRMASFAAERDLMYIAPDASGTFPRIGLYFSGTANTLVGTYGSENTVGAYVPAQDEWFWGVMSRAGTGAGAARLRVWNMSGTKVHETTGTDATDYTALDTILFGESGGGYDTFDGEVCNAKVHTGTEWSDAEAWTEAQKFLIQTAGGTDLYAFGLETTGAALWERLDLEGETVLLANTGCVDGASRPSALEAAYGSGADPIRAIGELQEWRATAGCVSSSRASVPRFPRGM